MRRSLATWVIVSALAAGVAAALDACSTTPANVQAIEETHARASLLRDFALPAPDLTGAKPVELWATYYSIPVVRELRRDGVALRDMDGRALGAKIGLRDFCDAAMQGTVRVTKRNGAARTYTYQGMVDDASAQDCSQWYPNHPALGKSRFKRAANPAGLGARGDTLVPFRSVAVDPRMIPHGTVLFVPASRGVRITLDSGESFVHDGYFYAADRGGGVRGNHIDVFIGAHDENPFPFVKSKARRTFEAYLLRDRELKGELEALHDS